MHLSHCNANAIMPFFIYKGMFECIGFFCRFRLTKSSSFFSLICLNLINTSNVNDWNVTFGWCDLLIINWLRSTMDFTKSVVTNPKPPSVVTQWFKIEKFHFDRRVSCAGLAKPYFQATVGKCSRQCMLNAFFGHFWCCYPIYVIDDLRKRSSSFSTP